MPQRMSKINREIAAGDRPQDLDIQERHLAPTGNRYAYSAAMGPYSREEGETWREGVQPGRGWTAGYTPIGLVRDPMDDLTEQMRRLTVNDNRSRLALRSERVINQ